jgi:Beta-propeller repeat
VVYAKIKTDTSGDDSLKASSYLGGSSGDGGDFGETVVAVGTDGRVYIASATGSSNFPGTTNPTTYDTSYNGAGDVFLAQMNIPDTANGTVLYATYLGGSDYEVVTDIAVEASSRVTIVGYTRSTNFQSINATSMLETYGGGYQDAFVAQFNPININTVAANGLSFKFNIGGGASDKINGVAVDANGMIYIAGRTLSTSLNGLINPSLSGATGFTQAIHPAPDRGISVYMGSTIDQPSYDLGCAQGQRDRDLFGRQDSLIMLFYGTPVSLGSDQGANLFSGSYFAYMSSIRESAKKYGEGYVACIGSTDTTSKITIAVGVNTYSTSGQNGVTFTHRAAWATMVNEVANYFLTSPALSSRVSAAGALNAELAFNTPARTYDWINGYDSVNTRDLYVAADAEGCPTSGASSTSQNCNHTKPAHLGSYQWTQDDLYRITRKPSAIFPQQYATNGASARQWQQIARYAYLRYGADIDFRGALTQQQACIDRACQAGTNNRAVVGWFFLREELYTDVSTAQNLTWSSDMKWQYP